MVSSLIHSMRMSEKNPGWWTIVSESCGWDKFRNANLITNLLLSILSLLLNKHIALMLCLNFIWFTFCRTFIHVLIFFIFTWSDQFRGIRGKFAFPPKPKVALYLIFVHGLTLYFEIDFWIIKKAFICQFCGLVVQNESAESTEILKSEKLNVFVS